MTRFHWTVGPLLNRPARKLLRQFLRDRSGTTAIEFAMIAVPFFGLIGAIFETGMVYFRNAELQTATESAKRVLLTHRATAGQTKQQFINQNVCTWKATGQVKGGTLSKSFDCEKVMIDVTRSSGIWSTVNNSGSDIYNATYDSAGTLAIPAPGEVAIVRILYPMPVLAGALGGSAVDNGKFGRIKGSSITFNSEMVHMLIGMSAFRVEPN